MGSLARDSENDDDHHYHDELLVLDWVPKSFIPYEVHQFVHEFRQKKNKPAAERGEEDECTTLSEFHFAGPAVLYGFRSLCPWAFALVICLIAYHSIGNFDVHKRSNASGCSDGTEHGKDCAAFLSYPLQLWLLFLPIAFFIWHVQMRCLSYVIYPQVHLLRGGFKAFGCSVSFAHWRCFAFVISVTTIMDITSQCIFYAQFLRSVERTPEIAKVWKATTLASFESFVPGYSNIVLLFTVCWSMMFLQMIYMILHMFTDEPGGVDYQFQSMPNGYTTVASCLHPVRIDAILDDRSDDVDHRGDACASSLQKPFVYWHADILRVLGIYGRMPVLVMNNMELLAARLKREPDLVRYLQIFCKRLVDNVSRVILLDIFELAFKLEIQVSILSIQLALNPASLDEAALQMCFAIALTLCNVLMRMAQNIQTWMSFHSLSKEHPDFHSTRCERNWKVAQRTLWVYFVAIVIFGLFIVHSVVKFMKAFTCEFSMWNLNGCVEFDSTTSADGVRMLVLD